jgi:DNA mismatch repair protein MutL
LGFRGEFLASLLAAADITIVSKAQDSNQAFKAFYSIDKDPIIENTSRTRGTTLIVENLFEKVPARRNFLPKAKTSSSRIHELVRQFTLAYPSIRFIFRNDNVEIFRSQPGNKIDAVTMVLGSNVAKKLLPITGEMENKSWKLDGFISEPVEARATRNSQYFFVNGRIIENNVIQKALEDGYRSYLATRKFPLAVLYLTADPKEFDANVHPAKKEIRIKSEHEVYNFISMSVYAALTGKFNHLSGKTNHQNKFNQQPLQHHLPWQDDRTTIPLFTPTQSKNDFEPAHDTTIEENTELNKVDTFDAEATSERDQNHPLEDRLQYLYDREVINPFGDEYFIHVIDKTEIRNLEPIVQLDKTFIVAIQNNLPDTFYIIDQHAAAERITLEKMIASKTKQLKQSLLQPLELRLQPIEYSFLEDVLTVMTSYGYTIEMQSNLIIKVHTIPFLGNKKLSKDKQIYNIREILSEGIKLQESEKNVSLLEQEILKSIACHNSIKAGEKLNHTDMKELLQQMTQAEFPWVCCHGRPSIFKLTTKKLYTLFWRN